MSQVSYYGYAIFAQRRDGKTPQAQKMIGEIHWILNDAVAEKNRLHSVERFAIDIRPVRVIVGDAITST